MPPPFGRKTGRQSFRWNSILWLGIRGIPEPIDPKAAGTTESNYPAMKSLGQLDGAWSVAFDPKWGGPAEPVTFDSLADWTTRPEDGIKYYSGSAIYTKKFDVPGDMPAGQRVMLDLGEVREIASVKLNGKELGVVWMHPARVDITGRSSRRGNQLEIKIVNLWPNRLIGDDSLPPEKQYTKFNMRNYYGKHLFAKGSPLRPSGLLGPVEAVDRRVTTAGTIHNEHLVAQKLQNSLPRRRCGPGGRSRARGTPQRLA